MNALVYVDIDQGIHKVFIFKQCIAGLKRPEKATSFPKLHFVITQFLIFRALCTGAPTSCGFVTFRFEILRIISVGFCVCLNNSKQYDADLEIDFSLQPLN